MKITTEELKETARTAEIYSGTKWEISENTEANSYALTAAGRVYKSNATAAEIYLILCGVIIDETEKKLFKREEK